MSARVFQEVSKILPPIPDDDCRVILQDWDETDPDQHVAMRLAAELINTRAALDELMDAAEACVTANVLRGSPKRARILAALAACKRESV